MIEIEVEGKRYRLEYRSGKHSALCNGCAFNPKSCNEGVFSNACVTELEGEGVWKELGAQLELDLNSYLKS